MTSIRAGDKVCIAKRGLLAQKHILLSEVRWVIARSSQEPNVLYIDSATCYLTDLLKIDRSVTTNGKHSR